MHSARDQDALGVHAAEDVAEALALLADQVLGRHAHVVEEHFRGGVVHHGADRADGQALHRPHIDHEHRQSFGALLDLFARRGAREQQHQIRMLGARGPDLLAVDDVVRVAFAHRGGAKAERVGARGRLGDAERLQAQLALGDARQPALLSARRCRDAAACPWCTSARGRLRRCSPRRGFPPGSRPPPTSAARCRRIVPG